MKKTNGNIKLELTIYLILAVGVFFAAGSFDLFEKLVSLVHAYEDCEADEIITTALFLLFCLAFFSLRRWREVVLARQNLEIANQNLKQALEEIKELKGVLPICAECKKIRDDAGYWQQLEEYISTHSEAVFSHGLCPECYEKALARMEDDQADEEPDSA